MNLLNNYAKRILTADDLPTDAETLRKGIRQLVDILLPEPSGLTTEGIHFTVGETVVFDYLLSAGQVTRSDTNAAATHLSRLRKKLGRMDIVLPRQGQMLTEDVEKRLRRIAKQVAGSQHELASLAAALSFDPRKYDESKLPCDVAGLRGVALKLVELLRGRPDKITIPWISSDSQNIALGTLLAKRRGVVTRQRLFTAVYLPFAKQPDDLNAASAILYRLRQELYSCRVKVTEHGKVGYAIDDSNRTKLLPFVHPSFARVML